MPQIDDHGIRRSDMGRILAQWWRPVAFKVSLDMLHWGTRSVLHWRIVIVVKMAHEVGAFYSVVDFMPCINVS